MANSCSVVLTFYVAFHAVYYSTEASLGDETGPCVIRRAKLPRLDPVKVRCLVHIFKHGYPADNF